MIATTNIETLREKFELLTRRYSDASEKRSRLLGKLDEKKADLTRLVEEIKAAGFNPKDLRAEKERLSSEVVELMTKFESELSNVETALKDLEG